jgi:hypothetical protein
MNVSFSLGQTQITWGTGEIFLHNSEVWGFKWPELHVSRIIRESQVSDTFPPTPTELLGFFIVT